jgi:MYXO-CTERM domain-containing protein
LAATRIQNKGSWSNLVGNATDGTWDKFRIEVDEMNHQIKHLAQPCGGSETMLGRSSVTRITVDHVNQVRMRTVNQSFTDTLNMDTVVVSPEPAALVLLGMGSLLALRRRR